MVKKKHILFLWVSIVIMSSSVKAQDPHFSQFFNTHQLYNPAITGSFDDDVRVSGHYRTQWRAAGKGYVTNAINAEGNFLYNSDSHFSAGVFVLNDLAGNAALKTFQAMASGAYHQKLSRKDAVSAGIQFSMLRRTIDFSGLKWDNQYDGIQYDPSIDPNEIWESNQVKRYDVAMGVNWRHKGELNYTLGYGFRHFGQDVSFLTGSVDRLPLRQTFIGSLERKTPFGLWRYEMLVQRQQRAMEICMGGRLEYRLGTDSRYTKVNTSSAVFAGGYYRVRDALSPFVGFEFRRMVSFCLSYDIPLSGVNRIVGWTGGPEFSLIYQGRFRERNTKLAN